MTKLAPRVQSAGDAMVFTDRVERSSESIQAFPNFIIFNDLQSCLIYHGESDVPVLEMGDMGEMGERSGPVSA
jgi:hypothetical protein